MSVLGVCLCPGSDLFKRLQVSVCSESLFLKFPWLSFSVYSLHFYVSGVPVSGVPIAVRVAHGKGLVEPYSTNFVEPLPIRGTLAYSHSIRGILIP